MFPANYKLNYLEYSPDSGTLKMHQTYSDAFKLIGKLENELS